MDGELNQVFFPKTLQELFNAWTRFPGAIPFAGGTTIIRNQENTILKLPKTILSLNDIHELRRMTRTERYLEIGAMVKLRDIIQLGKIVPEALTSSLEGIASPQLRGLATIGGNICGGAGRLDCTAPLIALDAIYELRSAQSARWISAARFSSIPGSSALGPQELLTRVRIPLEQWDFTACRKFGGRDSGNGGGILIFIMKNRKNILTGFRVIFAGEAVIRDHASETSLTGKQLPLSHREARDFSAQWRQLLQGLETPSPLIRSEILHYLESLVYNLAD
jgi:CO/xanthine dehydrogenase FAD-binding subunit